MQVRMRRTFSDQNSVQISEFCYVSVTKKKAVSFNRLDADLAAQDSDLSCVSLQQYRVVTSVSGSGKTCCAAPIFSFFRNCAAADAEENVCIATTSLISDGH